MECLMKWYSEPATGSEAKKLFHYEDDLGKTDEKPVM